MIIKHHCNVWNRLRKLLVIHITPPTLGLDSTLYLKRVILIDVENIPTNVAIICFIPKILYLITFSILSLWLKKNYMKNSSPSTQNWAFLLTIIQCDLSYKSKIVLPYIWWSFSKINNKQLFWKSFQLKIIYLIFERNICNIQKQCTSCYRRGSNSIGHRYHFNILRHFTHQSYPP